MNDCLRDITTQNYCLKSTPDGPPKLENMYVKYIKHPTFGPELYMWSWRTKTWGSFVFPLPAYRYLLVKNESYDEIFNAYYNC